MKKYLVVYFSRDGHTKSIAQEIAGQLKAEIEEVKDRKKRKGLWGYLFAGRDALYGRLTAINIRKYDPQKFDLVIIGTPIWSWSLTPAIRTYLTENKYNFKRVAFFCTMGGSGAERVFRQMEEIIGNKVPAKLSFLQKEVESRSYPERIKKFIKKLKS